MLPSKAGLVSIISLNWSHYQDLTGPFIRYIDAWTPDPKELIVVDQGSREEDRQALTEDTLRFPWLKVVLLPENTGFPRGNNLGLEEAEGEFIVVMNNDILLSGDWLRPLLEPVARPGARVVSGMSLVREGGWNEYGETVIPYLEGWLLVFHRRLIDEIGGYLFDESFGIGSVEDIDFCRRAVATGYELVEVPHLPVVHLRGRTVTDGRLDQPAITRRNYELMKARVLTG